MCVQCVGECHPIPREYGLWAVASAVSPAGPFQCAVRLAGSEQGGMGRDQRMPWSWAGSLVHLFNTLIWWIAPNYTN